MTSELDQIYSIETFAPIDSNKLNKKDGAEALLSLLFLIKKV